MSAGNQLPTDTEVLFFALQIVQRAETAEEAKVWAQDVLRFSGGSTEADVWPPPGAAEWQGKGSRPAPLYARLDKAYKSVWEFSELEAICLAIRAWRGAGQCDDLHPHHLYWHMAKLRPGPKLPSCKGKGTPPVRYKSVAILKVARLVKDSGPEMRRLLRSDVPREEVPTAREMATQLQQQVEQLEEELMEQKEARLRAEAAARMAQQRRAEQVKHMRAWKQVGREALAEKLKAFKEGLRREKAEQLDDENERMAKEYEAHFEEQIKSLEAVIEKLKRERLKARARARDAEYDAQTSQKRLKRAQRAEAELKRLRDELDERLPEAMDTDSDDEVQTSKCSRRDSGGRFQAESWRLRWLKWSQISRRVPTSAINANITEVLSVYAPQELTPQPTERSIRAMRVEATIAGEAINAWRFSKARRIISFGEDESTKWGKAIITTNTQIEPHNAPGTSADIVLRGGTLTAGGTSEALAKHLETKHLSHGRELLECWRTYHEKLWGAGTWERDGGAEPQQVGMHRLSENTLLMSDTCNGARKLKQLLAEMAEAAGRAKLGEEVWATMSEEERAAKVKTHLGDCNGHLRNIIIKAMITAATEHLQAELEDDLAEFSSFDRVTVDVTDLIYRVYKELHPSGEYAKGKGPEFEAWRKKVHASKMWMPFEHAGNTRQEIDIAFDGAVPLFINRELILEFLHSLNIPGASNKLEDCLRILFRSNEMTAILRVCTLFQVIFSDPMRWLAGKHEELHNFSIVSCSRMLELAEAMFQAIAADGHALLDPALDPFKEIADEQPLFRAWRVAREARVTKAPDGTAYTVLKAALAEARSPAGKGNAQATEMVVALAEKMANAALAAMHDSKRAIADKLTSQDGANAPGKMAAVHAATIGAHVINDHCESHFGGWDYLGRIFRGASTEALSGMTQQMHTHDFELPPNIAHDRRKAKADAPDFVGGFFHTGLNEKGAEAGERLRESLVLMARREAPAARKDGRLAQAEQDAERLARREERVITLLKATVEAYAYNKELFQRWEAQGARNPPAVVAALEARPAEAQKLEWLRLQIEMRVLGLGWSQFATRWSSKADSRIGSVAHLQKLLVEELLPFEMAERRLKKLPTEAAPPQSLQKEARELGALDADAVEVEKKTLFSTEELRRKSEEAMQRRVADGTADDVEALQPPKDQAPAFDQDLVGKWIEVRWRYTDKDTGEYIYIWSPGKVVRVADGLTDKTTKLGKKLLPAGAVLWAWEADAEFDEEPGEKWLTLRKDKFNEQVWYGWRLDPRELVARQPGAAQTPKAQRGARRGGCEAP